MELFLDTETSGLFLKGTPYSHPNFPWIVQIGVILADREQIYSEMCFLIKAENREISPEAQSVHGISKVVCDSLGLKEKVAAGLFFFMLSKASKLIGHNIDFDVLMLKALFHRQDHQKVCLELDSFPKFCTMKRSTDLCKIPSNYRGKFKFPKLSEVYKLLFNEEIEGAHNALIDIRATRRVYYKLQEVL